MVFLRHLIDAPIGTLAAVADNNFLYSLKFADRGQGYHAIQAGKTPVTDQLERELHAWINTGGKLGGYSASSELKKWLLYHEHKITT